jgi:predicted AAA+ superfamily ATPase
MKLQALILYRNMEQEDILKDMAYLFSNYENSSFMKDDLQALCFQNLHKLIELASTHGFSGNIWHAYLTYLIINHENAYSLACELLGENLTTDEITQSESVRELAWHDFIIFQKFYQYDFTKLLTFADRSIINAILNFHLPKAKGFFYNKHIRNRICRLSTTLGETADISAFQTAIATFYKCYGVGKLGLHKAFRVQQKKYDVEIAPISNIAQVKLSDLIGYDLAKKKLIDNTEAFIQGKEANNCLLFGDAGTGKSSSIKAVVNQYYEQGLRMIELYKHQFQALHEVIAQIKNRNYKFIIYMDDLSFEDFEVEYKYLKAVIEGGLEKKPDNILIYATSNRRHLIREKFSDRDELHKSDTVVEKLSLAARFGVTIYFGAPEPAEFKQIVLGLAKRNQIDLPEEELLLLANQWELNHGGLSGRSAQQFITYLLGCVVASSPRPKSE